MDIAYAQAYGLKGSRVENAEGLAPTLEGCFRVIALALPCATWGNRAAQTCKDL